MLLYSICSLLCSLCDHPLLDRTIACVLLPPCIGARRWLDHWAHIVFRRSSASPECNHLDKHEVAGLRSLCLCCVRAYRLWLVVLLSRCVLVCFVCCSFTPESNINDRTSMKLHTCVLTPAIFALRWGRIEFATARMTSKVATAFTTRV